MARLKSLIGLLILVSMAYVGWNAIPPYFANRELQQFVSETAIRESYTTHSESEIASMVAQKAAQLGVPLTEEQIKVEKGENKVDISAEYSVHVDLKFRPIDMNFKIASKNQGMGII